MANEKSKLKVISLGGLGEIGKNITAFEYGEDIIVVDCGIAFPEDDMLGIDLVMPDITYLKKNSDRVRGIIITHGHEDHIGGLPYVLKDLNAPVYGSRLSLGLIEIKLEEHRLLNDARLHKVEQGQTIELGDFKVEFINSCHSISDAFALAIHTPVGVVVHTGDFKVDYTPIRGNRINLRRFAELGSCGVLLLMSDSTNAEREGYTMSEKIVGEAFRKLFSGIRGRIIVATFASNTYRVQQIINAAVCEGRKVALSGRSMVNVVNVAIDLGYLEVPEGILVDIKDIDRFRPEEMLIITTGSQGEPMSALTRMAASTHRQVEIVPGDLIVISATPIPGNEKPVSRVINQLIRKGANVVYKSLDDIHVSGHACQEELKLIYSLTSPRYFMPVHGEYKHLKEHAQLINELGMPDENIFIMDIGSVLELDGQGAAITGKVPAGKIFIDGLGVGDVGNIVLRDRKVLSQEGMVIVVISIEKETGNIISEPDIVSRGFVYVRESEEIIEKMRQLAYDILLQNSGKDWGTMKGLVRETLRAYLDSQLKRNPMILPIIIEV